MRESHLLFVIAVGVAGCCANSPVEAGPELVWDDGDSGRLGDLKFRLADVDAPETWRPKCEEERVLGYEAKAFMEDLTEGRRVTITSEDGYDGFNRLLVTLSVGGRDVAEAGLEAGVLREWPHDGTKAQADRPDWCGDRSRISAPDE